MSKPIRIAILADGRKAKSELQSVAKETTALGKVGGLAGRTLKRGLLVGGGAIAALAGTALFKGFGRLRGIEQAEAKLSGLGHSTTSVQRIMESALNSVKGTAFGLDEAATTAASAVAAGIKPGKELQRYLTLVGDAAVQTNTSMGDMGRVMNKARTIGAAYNDTLQVLAERGLPVYQLLSKELGVSTAEVKKLASEGQISAQVLEDALRNKIGGAAQKAGKTVEGSAANAQAALGRLGASVLKPTFQRLPKALRGITDRLDAVGPYADRAGRLLGRGVGTAIDKISKASGKMFSPGALESQRDRLDALRSTGERLWSGTKKLARGTADLVRSFKPAVVKTFNTVLDGTVSVVEGAGKVFETTAGAAGGAGTMLASIPGPIKEIAVQGALAALVMPRLAAGAAVVSQKFDLAQTSARVLALEMRDGTARATMMRNALSQMGGMARNVAGVGGMVMLAQGAQTANRDLQALADVGGGAMLGFALGGPIGAAIGAGAGLLKTTLTGGADAAKGSIDGLKIETEALVDTLDDLTGATTRATRGLVLQELQTSGLLGQTRELGLTDRQVVNAMMNQGKARENLAGLLGAEKSALEGIVAARESEISALERERNQYGMFGGSVPKHVEDSLAAARAKRDEAQARLDGVSSIEKELGAVDAARKAKEAEIRATIEFGGAIRNLPKEVRVALRSQGITGATTDLAKFARQHKLTPKQIRYLVKAVDATASEKKIEAVRKKAQELGNVKPNMKLGSAVQKGMSEAEGAASRGGKKVEQKLNNSTAKAKPKMGGFNAALRQGVSTGTGIASSGGSQVGSALSDGAASGVRARAGAVAAEARAMVRNAIAAAKAEAQSKSPSKKMIRFGHDLVDGAVIGIRKKSSKAARAMRRMTSAILKAAQGGDRGSIRSELAGQIDAQNRATMKAYDREAKAEKARFYRRNKSEKARKAFDKRQAKDRKATEKALDQAKRSALKSVKAETRALAANQRALAKVTEALASARSKVQELKDARDSFAGSIKSSFVELGNIANFDEGHMNSPQALVEQLRERVRIADRFEAAVQRLRGMDLNETSLTQLLERGPEAGLAAAEALAAGGAATIEEINALTAQLAAQGGALGTSVASQFHDAGIAAAEGLVAGLEAKEAELIKQATKLAKLIAKAIRKELKIKSPSQVLAGDGVNAALGLVVGMGRTRDKVYRAGVKVADALRNGVETRRLVAPIDPRSAYANVRSLDAQRQGITVTLTAQQVSQLQRGREIRMDLDAYERAGGRRAS